MTPTRKPLLAVLALAIAAGAGCDDSPSGTPGPPAKPKAATRTEWSTDEMAADPEGYLVWADEQLGSQVKLREERIATVKARRDDLSGRKQAFSANFDDLVNVEKRLATALRKAEEEDRLPVRMGGRTFERAKAQAILVEIRRHVDERSPLVRTYDEGLAKLDQIATTLKNDVDRLTALRDRLAVDLEQVRVSHGVAELETLRTTEAEISHYAKILSSMAEDATGALPSTPPPVDLDKLLE